MPRKIRAKVARVDNAPRRTISRRWPVRSPSQPHRLGAMQRISMGMATSSPMRAGEKPRWSKYSARNGAVEPSRAK
ncbi:hypothetical protein D3C75_1121080 [compost metagenome]